MNNFNKINKKLSVCLWFAMIIKLYEIYFAYGAYDE